MEFPNVYMEKMNKIVVNCIVYEPTQRLSGRIGLIEIKRSLFLVIKMANISYRYNQVPHLTHVTTWVIGKYITKHHKQELRGQPSPSR